MEMEGQLERRHHRLDTAAAKGLNVEGLAAARAAHTHDHAQKSSVGFLFVGSVLGLLGFILAFVCAVADHALSANITVFDYFYNPRGANFKNYLGEPFPSGETYMPQTLSEMVHSFISPEGKTFYAFCTIAPLCILMSRYPSHLRNVYLGDDSVIYSRCPLSWMNLRQFVPPVCMYIVTCIPVAPPVNRTLGDVIAVKLHTIAAVTLNISYVMSEIFTLFIARRWYPKCGLQFKPRERAVRATLVFAQLACAIVFSTCGAIVPKPLLEPDGTSCADVYVIPNATLFSQVDQAKSPLMTSLHSNQHRAYQISAAIDHGERLLYDTASGWCLQAKRAELFSEILAGLLLLSSHFAIWWFCPERFIDLHERLPGLSKREMRSQGYDEEYVRDGWGENPAGSDEPESSTGESEANEEQRRDLISRGSTC